MHVVIDQYHHVNNSAGTNIIGIYSTEKKAIEAIQDYAQSLQLKLESSGDKNTWWSVGGDGYHWIINWEIEIDKIYEWNIED
jgi:hypothetical protein